MDSMQAFACTLNKPTRVCPMLHHELFGIGLGNFIYPRSGVKHGVPVGTMIFRNMYYRRGNAMQLTAARGNTAPKGALSVPHNPKI